MKLLIHTRDKQQRIQKATDMSKKFLLNSRFIQPQAAGKIISSINKELPFLPKVLTDEI